MAVQLIVLCVASCDDVQELCTRHNVRLRRFLLRLPSGRVRHIQTFSIPARACQPIIAGLLLVCQHRPSAAGGGGVCMRFEYVIDVGCCCCGDGVGNDGDDAVRTNIATAHAMIHIIQHTLAYNNILSFRTELC